MTSQSGEAFDLVVKGGLCATPNGIEETDIGVRQGRIAGLGDLGAAKSAEIFDARGLHVLPGVVDTQVHFREPGNEHKEDLETGTKAAVLGGVTAVFEMPNTNPSTVHASDLADKLKRADGRAWCDIAFYIGAAAENADKLARYERLPGCCGVKIFMGSSTGSLLVPDDDSLLKVLKSGSRRVAVHSEDEYRLRKRRPLVETDDSHPRLHPVWRDEETAVGATKRLLHLAVEAHRRIHVLHVSTGDEMDILRQYRDIATVEVTPQHLTLEAPDCYDRLGTYAQMNPPIRGAKHREALWRAVTDGTVDVLGSDHAPHTRAEKDTPYPKSPSGMPGVQTLVPVMLDHVAAGRLSLARFVDLTSAGPTRVFNIAGKGRIAAGYDADFTLADLRAKKTISDGWIASRCGWTPFAGMKVTGWPKGTIIRGHIVMRDDEVVGKPAGRPIRFGETL